MQHTQKLTTLFRKLLEEVDTEASKNPEFANRIAAVLVELPSRGRKRPREKRPRTDTLTPDVFEEFKQRGDQEFGFWLRSLELATLKAIVRQNGFDPGKNSVRWTEPDKFVALVRDQTISQLRRGSAFLPQRSESAGNQ